MSLKITAVLVFLVGFTSGLWLLPLLGGGTFAWLIIIPFSFACGWFTLPIWQAGNKLERKKK